MRERAEDRFILDVRREAREEEPLDEEEDEHADAERGRDGREGSAERREEHPLGSGELLLGARPRGHLAAGEGLLHRAEAPGAGLLRRGQGARHRERDARAGERADHLECVARRALPVLGEARLFFEEARHHRGAPRLHALQRELRGPAAERALEEARHVEEQPVPRLFDDRRAGDRIAHGRAEGVGRAGSEHPYALDAHRREGPEDALRHVGVEIDAELFAPRALRQGVQRRYGARLEQEELPVSVERPFDVLRRAIMRLHPGAEARERP
jgi:hypothetical protein